MRLTLDESFRPPWWLRNSHAQSILPSLPLRRLWVVRRAAPLLAASREILLDCGDGVRLQCFHSTPPSPTGRLAVLLHGWEGSTESLYILSLAQRLFDHGFDVVRLNLRDHGDTHHLNRELFHSCRLPEAVGAVSRLRQLFPSHSLHLVGFSLGGNFMLRVAATTSLDIAGVVAVSPVIDPAETMMALERGFPVYRRYFARKWLRSLLRKQALWPHDYDFSELAHLTDLRRMTAVLVRRYTDFASLEDYLNGYSITGQRLAPLSSPATIITALDDPIIPANDLRRLGGSDALHVVLTRHGGHCGFLTGLLRPSWAEDRIIAALGAERAPIADPKVIRAA